MNNAFFFKAFAVLGLAFLLKPLSFSVTNFVPSPFPVVMNNKFLFKLLRFLDCFFLQNPLNFSGNIFVSSHFLGK